MNSLLVFLLIQTASHAIERIAEVNLDRSKPFTINMHPGRTTTIDLPCAISYAMAGAYNDLKAEIGPDKDSSLVLWLTSHASSPTNLVVRCDERVLVFDIIPSRNNHQDYLKIKKITEKPVSGKLIADSKNYIAMPSFRKKELIKKSESF
ncbi:MAG: hypothetical protein IT245_01280 [Bacteroidia bacterium]|nr:hypothetical protein [Bacteroidia bacterium]